MKLALVVLSFAYAVHASEIRRGKISAAVGSSLKSLISENEKREVSTLAAGVQLNADSDKELSGSLVSKDGTVLNFNSTLGQLVLADSDGEIILDHKKFMESKAAPSFLQQVSEHMKMNQRLMGSKEAANAIEYAHMLGESHRGNENRLALQFHMQMIALGKTTKQTFKSTAQDRSLVQRDRVKNKRTEKVIRTVDSGTVDTEEGTGYFGIAAVASLVHRYLYKCSDDGITSMACPRNGYKLYKQSDGTNWPLDGNDGDGPCGREGCTASEMAAKGLTARDQTEIGVCGPEFGCMDFACGDCGCHNSCLMHDEECCGGMLAGDGIACDATSALVMLDCSCCNGGGYKWTNHDHKPHNHRPGGW